MASKPWTKGVLITTGFLILLPVCLLAIWTFTGRWPWPGLLPKTYTLRTWQELLFGTASLGKLLQSSILLALVTAGVSTVVALMTARACVVYLGAAGRWIQWMGMMPLIIPGTVLTIGCHLVLLQLRLSDTWLGVLLVHVLTALPYSMAILTDLTARVGTKLEEQAQLLGASGFTAFYHGSLPSLMPGIFASMSMAFILSYSQYFSTLIVGGGRVQTLALVMVPYIQSGDRPLASVYAVAFTGSALLVFAILEGAAGLFRPKGGR